MRSLFLLLLSFGMAGGFAQDQIQDQFVKVRDGTAGTNGVLVWGNYDGEKLIKEFRGQEEVVNIGDVKPGAKHSKVATFANGRAPGYATATWKTSGPRPILEVENPPTISIPVRVWVLCRAKICKPEKLTVDEEDDLLRLLGKANTLFAVEEAGIRMDLTNRKLLFEDKKADPKKTRFQEFEPYAKTKCEAFADLKLDMFDTKALNLYFVRTVSNREGQGDTCAALHKNVAVFGRGADAGLIAHEIGHLHNLDHSDFTSVPEGHSKYGKLNIMHPDSVQRKYLSEGEVYVMHFDDRSLTNWCIEKTASKPCLQLKVREGVGKCEDRKVAEPVCPTLDVRLREDPK
ncbi:MAG: hypothetical protein NTV52_21770 [Acidobacteria bacterium]|nr:hypothetical protein [Acidobacteriota bacterium]